MRQLVIGGYTRGTDTGLNFQRLLGPFTMMQKQWPDEWRYKPITQLNWITLSDVDVLVVQEPYQKSEATGMEIARRMGIPVIADFCDDYLHIPVHNNMTRHLKSEKEARERISECLQHANQVWVGSDKLKETYLEIHSSVFNLVNAVDKRVFGTTHNGFSTNKTVVWRGGESHLCDFTDEVEKALIELSTKYLDWQWHFVGYGPFRIFDRMQNVFYHPLTDLVLYHANIMEIAPSICIVPLKDDEFNRAKTFQAWAEGTWAGANVLAPNFPLWQFPGCLNYKQGAFQDKLEGLMQVPEVANWRESILEIKTEHMLEKRNMARRELLLKLFR